MEIILEFLRNIPVEFMIIPLIICSILLLAVFIERIIAYRILDQDYAKYINNRDLINDKKIKFNPILRILNLSNNKERLKNTDVNLERMTHDAVQYIERFSGVVSTIATISPMIGLLGTVTGMMKSFSVLSSKNAGYEKLAGGITEALLTTALGLLVAIPSIVLYNYMINKSAYLIKETENIANRVSDEKI